MPTGAQPLAPQARMYRMRGMGVATVIMLVVAILTEMMADMSPFAARSMAQRALENDDLDLLNQARLIDGLIAMPSLGALIVAGVLVIIWLYRARKNLDAFPEATGWMRPGWAIGGWLIPFANLVIPGRMMASVVRESMPASGGMIALVWLWWFGWIIGNGTDGVATMRDSAEFDALPTVISGPDDYQAYIDYFAGEPTWSMPAMVLTMLTGAVLSYLIMRVSSAQQARIEGAEPPPILPGSVVSYPVPPFAPPR